MRSTESAVPVPALFGAGSGELEEMRTVTVPRFTPKPIASPPVPQHPHMAPNGTSNAHNDAYMSDAYDWSGLNGGELEIGVGRTRGHCATLLFDERGRIVTVCTSLVDGGKSLQRTLLLLDPQTMEVLASYDFPYEKPKHLIWLDQGGYVYLDSRRRPVVPTFDQTVEIFEILDPPEFEPVASYNLARAIGDPAARILSALPDWSGRIWFVTDTGVVGYVDPATVTVHAIRLASPERIGNSFAVDDTGGVFVVSDHAQYRFDVGPGGEPMATWRCAYDRGTTAKPGLNGFGSGTSPTLIGDSWLGITDGADSRTHVLVYRREAGYPGNREAARVPVFTAESSLSVCNSLTAVGNGFVVGNNDGYTGTLITETSTVTPGLARVAIANGGSTVWSTDRVAVPSGASKVSLANGLIYSYTLRQSNDDGNNWYVSAVDAWTGEVAWEVYAGPGRHFDNHYAALYVGPDGTIYVPVWFGIVRLAPAQDS